MANNLENEEEVLDSEIREINPVFSDNLDVVNNGEDNVIDEPEDDTSIPVQDQENGEQEVAPDADQYNQYPVYVGLDYWTNNGGALKTGYNLNKYPYYQTSRTTAGITYTVNEDGSLTMDGTATTNSYFYFHNRNADPISLPQGTYKIVPNTELIGDSWSGMCVNWTNASGAEALLATTATATTKNFTVTEDISKKGVGVYYRVKSGTTITNLTVTPLVIYSNLAERTFEPYGKYHKIVKGKNLAQFDQSINTDASVFSYTSNVEGKVVCTKVSGGGRFFATYRLNVESGKSYTFSYEQFSGSAKLRVYLYSDRIWGTGIANFLVEDAPTYTATTTGEIVVGLWTPSASTDMSVTNFMIRESTVTDTTWVPCIEEDTWAELPDDCRDGKALIFNSLNNKNASGQFSYSSAKLTNVIKGFDAEKTYTWLFQIRADAPLAVHFGSNAYLSKRETVNVTTDWQWAKVIFSPDNPALETGICTIYCYDEPQVGTIFIKNMRVYEGAYNLEGSQRIDEVEKDSYDIDIEGAETNDLTEPPIAIESYEPKVVLTNEETLPTIGNVQEGDRVMIALIGGEPTVLGTVGSGDRQQLKIDQTAMLADHANTVAGNTNQYFWHASEGADTGAHITEKTQEEFLQNPANGGGNTLIRSNGMAVRDGLTELATFTADGVQIGEFTKAHLTNDYHSMRLVDKDGKTFFHVSDLRNQEGIAQVVEELVVLDFSLIPQTFELLNAVETDDITVVDANNNQLVKGTDFTYSIGSKDLTLNVLPTQNYFATYWTKDSNTKAFTLGERSDESFVGIYSTNIGLGNAASGNYSTAIGLNNQATGDYSLASGWNTSSTSFASHSEGFKTKAQAFGAHAEGGSTKALADYAHAQGCATTASGKYSTAGGYNSTASGQNSFADGMGAKASGMYSHSMGWYTEAQGEAQTVLGKFNVPDNTSLLIVGNGMPQAQSNALTLTQEGFLSIQRLVIPKQSNRGIYNTDGNRLIADYGNSNIVVNASGKTLYLGYENTTSINVLNGKASFSSNDLTAYSQSFFYKAGDTISINGNSACYIGHITSDAKQIRIQVPVEKYLTNISTITVTKIYGNLRGVAGYIQSSNYNFATGSTVTASKVDNRTIIIDIVSNSTAFTHATNNTVAVFSPVGTGGLAFKLA